MGTTFNNLSTEDKIDFFLKCQELLINNYPNSRFLITEENIKDRLSFIQDFFNNYKGFVYNDEHVCIMYNYIKITDKNNPVEVLNTHKFQPPVIDYNAISIDFGTMDSIKNLKKFCETFYNSQIKYVMFVRQGRPAIYDTLDLITKFTGIKKV